MVPEILAVNFDGFHIGPAQTHGSLKRNLTHIAGCNLPHAVLDVQVDASKSVRSFQLQEEGGRSERKKRGEGGRREENEIRERSKERGEAEREERE